MKVKKIFSKKLANYLCNQGFYIVDTEIHNKKPWLYVYLFEDSEKLRLAMENYQGDTLERLKGGRRNDSK